MVIWQAELSALMSTLAYAAVALALVRLFREHDAATLGSRRWLIAGVLAAEAVLQAGLLLGLLQGWQGAAAALPLAAAAGQLVIGISLWPLLAGIKARFARAMGRRIRQQVERANTEAATANTWLELAEEAAQFGHWQVDLSSQEFIWSAAMYRLHGVTPDDFIPTLETVLALFHPDDRKTLSGNLALAMTGGGDFEVKLRLRRPDTELRHAVMRGRALGKTMFAGVLVDITTQHQAEARLREANAAALQANAALREMTLDDDLTGISNRRQFDLSLVHEFKRAVRSSLPLGLVLIDLDYFQAYNETYGQAAGDACLRRVAQAIKSVPRRTGDVVARHGGGQIAVLLPLADDKGAARVASVILEAVQALRIPHAGSETGVLTISCGAAAFTGVADLNNPQELVRRANQALYKAKTDGRDRVIKFDKTLNGDPREFYSQPVAQDMERFIKSRVS